MNLIRLAHTIPATGKTKDYSMFPPDETFKTDVGLSNDPTIDQIGFVGDAIEPEESVKPCCVTTINVHARFNPMMVCSECKHIIKCFKDEPAYDKYLIFCKSRKRQVAIGRVGEYHTIIFKSYDAFR